jgi:hypothetical protein
LGEQPFVVVSGLPGSGKTTLGRRLARALGLPLIDKDDILERLFETKGIGDTAWRRAEPGERRDSAARCRSIRRCGAHLRALPSGRQRALQVRRRDRGRALPAANPSSRTPGRRGVHQEVLASLRALIALPPIAVGERIDVDTSREPELNALVPAIRAAFDKIVQ